jgi:putative molybdopterin biosynthesis protein
MDAREVATTVAKDIADGRRAPGDRLPAVRSLAREARCAPGTAARAYATLRSAGIVAGRDRARHVVAADGGVQARAWLVLRRGALRLAGSDDPALDILLRAAGDAVGVVGGPRGSLTGLIQLARGEVDAAALHLRHAPTGRFNDPFVRAALPDERTVLIRLWRREQGLVVAQDNPLGIRGVRDLAGRRVAWRRDGTASRLLLERLLMDVGIEPRPGSAGGYDSHLGVAAAVATGTADAGLAVRAVAHLTGLEWVPVATEPFELALHPDALAAAAPLLDALASTGVQCRLSELPGYDFAESGRVRTAA